MDMLMTAEVQKNGCVRFRKTPALRPSIYFLTPETGPCRAAGRALWASVSLARPSPSPRPQGLLTPFKMTATNPAPHVPKVILLHRPLP